MNYTELTTKQRKNIRSKIENPTRHDAESLIDIGNRIIQDIFGIGNQDVYYEMLSRFKEDQTRLYNCEVRDGKLFLDGNETTCPASDFTALLGAILFKPDCLTKFKNETTKDKEKESELKKSKLLEIIFVETLFSIWQDLQNKRENNAT